MEDCVEQRKGSVNDNKLIQLSQIVQNWRESSLSDRDFHGVLSLELAIRNGTIQRISSCTKQTI